MTSTIIAGGREIPCAARVVRNPERTFTNRKRPTTRTVCWHHTGGDNGAGGVFRTLSLRGLSVHFAIDNDGLITQYCDADAYCMHAGRGNIFSVGVEISNRADKRAVVNGRPTRAVLVENIHGVATPATTFLQPQITAALQLAESLSQAYGLPMAVPTEGGKVVSTLLPDDQVATFRGHIGHFHLSLQKRDPGLALLAAIHERRARLVKAQTPPDGA